jgi:hypothetical protein
MRVVFTKSQEHDFAHSMNGPLAEAAEVLRQTPLVTTWRVSPHGGDVDALSRVALRPDSESATGRPANRGRGVKARRGLSLAIAVYGMAVRI